MQDAIELCDALGKFVRAGATHIKRAKNDKLVSQNAAVKNGVTSAARAWCNRGIRGQAQTQRQRCLKSAARSGRGLGEKTPRHSLNAGDHAENPDPAVAQVCC
jgi:hypothetical protein